MSVLEYAFRVENISLDDRFLIAGNDFDPNVENFDAPAGSLYIKSSGTLFIKDQITGTWKSTTSENDKVKINALDPASGYLVDKLVSSHLSFSPSISNDYLTVNLSASGIIAGTYSKVVFDQYGRAIEGLALNTTDITTALGYSPVNKAGDVMTGSLSLPGNSTGGLLIDSQYGWHDLKGEVMPHTLGLYAARRIPFLNDVTAWAHPPSAKGDVTYHIPHDYSPGTNLYIHVHWGHNGQDISGEFKVNFDISYARRGPQALLSEWTTPIMSNVTISNLSITEVPTYDHRVDEILLSTPGGAVNLLNTDFIEVDGVIVVNYQVEKIPSITGSPSENLPFIFYIDIHYQSTNTGTFLKDPGFYN